MNVKHTVSAGALVGVLEISATFPLEYLKRAMQLQQQASPRARASGTPRFASLAECATHTVRHHGVLGLYRGFSGWLVFAGPRSAIRFATFDALSPVLSTRRLSAEKRDALCGFGAGLAEAGLAQTPNQAIAVKMIHDQSPGGAKRFRTFWHATRVIYAELGVRRGFFCGLQPALVKGACTNAIRFPAFNAIKRLLEGDDASVSRPLPAASLCAGAAAGALSAVATQPIDTVMAAMQGLEAETFRKHGLVGTTRVLVKAGGVRCLYYGLVPRLARVTLEVALQFTLFEQIGSRLDAWLS